MASCCGTWAPGCSDPVAVEQASCPQHVESFLEEWNPCPRIKGGSLTTWPTGHSSPLFLINRIWQIWWIPPLRLVTKGHNPKGYTLSCWHSCSDFKALMKWPPGKKLWVTSRQQSRTGGHQSNSLHKKWALPARVDLGSHVLPQSALHMRL